MKEKCDDCGLERELYKDKICWHCIAEILEKIHKRPFSAKEAKKLFLEIEEQLKKEGFFCRRGKQ